MSETSQEYLDESIRQDNIGNDRNVLHALRKSIDALIQFTGDLKKGEHTYGREMSLVYTKLQEAKMWAGKCLEALGSELPAEFQDKAKIEEGEEKKSEEAGEEKPSE